MSIPETKTNDAKCTISVYLHDRPGALIRVALAYSRRGFNINSLVVNRSSTAGVSRMTITSFGDPTQMSKVVLHLSKLVDVVNVINHTDQKSHRVEIAYIQLACKSDGRAAVIQICDHFGCDVVGFDSGSITIRTYGSEEKIDSLIELFNNYEIVEIVRSGEVVIGANTRFGSY